MPAAAATILRYSGSLSAVDPANFATLEVTAHTSGGKSSDCWPGRKVGKTVQQPGIVSSQNFWSGTLTDGRMGTMGVHAGILGQEACPRAQVRALASSASSCTARAWLQHLTCTWLIRRLTVWCRGSALARGECGVGFRRCRCMLDVRRGHRHALANRLVLPAGCAAPRRRGVAITILLHKVRLGGGESCMRPPASTFARCGWALQSWHAF